MVTRFAIAAPLLLLAAGCASGPAEGQVLPDFHATTLTGTEVSRAAYDDQVLILYFFGHW